MFLHASFALTVVDELANQLWARRVRAAVSQGHRDNKEGAARGKPTSMTKSPASMSSPAARPQPVLLVLMTCTFRHARFWNRKLRQSPFATNWQVLRVHSMAISAFTQSCK